MAVAEPPRDDIHLSFHLHRHGWSNLCIFDGATLHDLRISAVFTDAPARLLDLAAAVLDNRAEEITLEDEPGRHSLSVSPDPQQHIMRLVLRDQHADPSLRLDARMKRRQLITELMMALWKPHVLLREPSYQKDRSRPQGRHHPRPDFPHKALRTLNARWADDPVLGPSCLH